MEEEVELVIKIPQDILNTIWAYVQSEIHNENIVSDIAYKAIANGTVLPKKDDKSFTLDEIKEEIKEESRKNYTNSVFNKGLYRALEIIDRHLGVGE